MSQPPFALGAVLSPPDPRDYKVAAYLPAAVPALPVIFDFRDYLGAAVNQGQEGTCVAHALARGMMVYYEATSHLNRLLSIRWAYEGARKLQPVNGEGAIPRAALEYARTVGLPPEADQPYQAGHPMQPGPDAAKHAALNKLAAYASVGLTVDAIKQALYHFGPVLIAIPAFQGLFDANTAPHVAHPTGKNFGNHALCIAGWDDNARCFFVRNSWGPDWGDRGYFLLPYDAYPILEAWSAVPALLPDGTPPPIVQPWWYPIAHLFRIA